jgi:heptosyltransferase-3
MQKNRKIKIGVIKVDSIGDAVLASPFFFGLRQNYRNAEITAFLSPQGKEVLDGLNLVDRIETVDPKWLKYKKVNPFLRYLSALTLLLKINRHKFDILIGLRYQDRLSSMVLSRSNAVDKYGYDVMGAGSEINHKMAIPKRGLHETEKHMLLLQRLTGRKYPVKLGFSVSKKSEENIQSLLKKGLVEKFIVMHPVSGHESKDWGVDKYCRLAEMLSKKYSVIVIGGKQDREARSIIGTNIVNLIGMMSIKEMGSLIRRAQLVVGNDSAAVHIASAFNVKSITLFSGAAMYEEWGAVGANSYLITKDIPCRGCEKPLCGTNHECMDIPVSAVYDTIMNILKGKQKNKIIKAWEQESLFT